MFYKGIVSNISKILDVLFLLETGNSNKYMSEEYKLKYKDSLTDIESTLERLVKRLSLNLFHSQDKL